MEHPKTEFLDAYALDRLFFLTDAKSYQLLDQHIATCEECKFYVSALRQARIRRKTKADDELQQLENQSKFIRLARFAEGKECPDDELIANYIEGYVNKEQTDEIVQHLRVCEYCSEAVNSIQPQVIDKPATRPVKRPESSTFWGKHLLKRYLIPAAALLLFVLTWQVDKRRQPSRERSEMIDVVRIELVAPGDRAKLPFKFQWRSFEEATKYVLVIWDQETLTSSRTERTELIIESSEMSNLKAGKQYVWQVQAYIGSRKIGESETRTLIVEE